MKDRDETKQRIINAVGKIFRTQGRDGLNVSRIAREAGVDRSLIYQYFGKNINDLIETYILQKDYWMRFAGKINAEVGQHTHESSKELIIDILQNQWRYFSADAEMQQLILWELSGDSDLMRSIHNTREINGQSVLELAKEHFKENNIKFEPIAVLLLGGIYYANIHTIHNGSIMCGMDIKTEEGQQDMMNAIRQIVEWAYQKV
jgi:AcrR family transcriptional regulator